MDTIRQSVQVVDDGASSTIEQLKAAWSSYLQEVQQGTAPTTALSSAFEGLVSTASGLAPSLSEVQAMMSSLGIEAGGAASALDAQASSADNASASNQALGSTTDTATATTKELTGAQGHASESAHELAINHFELRDAIEAANGGTYGTIDLLSRLGPEVAGVGAVLFALTEILNDQAKAYENDEVAAMRLSAVEKSNAPYYAAYKTSIDAAIASGEKLGFTNDTVTQALARMTPFIKDVPTQLRALAAAEDLSRVSGDDLTNTSIALGRAIETGQMRVLYQYGIHLKAGADATTILNAVEAKYADSAAAYADTVAGANAKSAASYEALAASGGTSMANFHRDFNNNTAQLYDNLKKTGEAGAIAGAAIGHTKDIWETLGSISPAITTSLDSAMGVMQDTATTTADTSGEMASIVQHNIDAWASTLDAREAAAAEKTREHMAAMLGYMKISGETGPAGEAAGKAFADYLAAQLAIAVATTQGDVATIVAELNIARIALAELNGAKADAIESASQLETQQAAYRATVASNKQIAKDNAASDARENSAHGNVVGGGIYETVGEQNTNLHNAQLAAEAARKAAQKSGGGPSAATLAKQAAAADKHLQQLKDTADAEIQAVADKNALAQATDKVTAAQDKQNADNLQAKNTMQGLADEAKKLGQAEKDSMSVAEAGLKNTQKALDDLKAEHQKAIGAMQEQIYQYNQQLLKTKAEDEALIAPLQAVAAAAQNALDAMNAATQAQDRVFTHQQEALAADQRAFDAMAKQIMGPLNAAYDAATARVTALQEAQQAITDLYAGKLLPIEQELQAIQNTQAQDNRTQGIEDQAKTVANLNAQLNNAVVGSKEYNDLLAKRDAAQKLLGQDEKVDSLTNQQQALQKARDAALQANAAQLKQAQAQQKAAEEARVAEQKLLDQQKTALDERMAAAQLEQQLYDQQRRDQAQALQDAKTKADGDLKTAQATAAAKEKIINDEILKVQERETAYQHDAAIQEAAQQTLVTGAQASVDQLKVIYGGLHDALTVKTDNVKTYLDSVGAIDAANLKDAQAASAELSTSIGDRKDAAAAAKALADYSAAYGVSGPTATQALKDATPAFQAAAPAMTAVGNAFKNDLAPAMGGMATQVATPLGNTGQTFLDYFGGQGQSKDLTKSIPWMVDGRNKKGLIASLNFFFDVGLGIDGLKGMTILRMDDWKATFEGYLTAESAIAKTQAAAIGNAIIDGIEVPLADPTKRAALGTAIADAVKAAMVDAQNKLEISSPSKLSGRMLGEPIGSGVAGGITGSGGQITTALNNVLANALGSNQRSYGSVPYGGAGGQGRGYAGGTSTIVLDVRANGVSVSGGLPSVPGLLSPQQIRTVAIEIKRELEMGGIR